MLINQQSSQVIYTYTGQTNFPVPFSFYNKNSVKVGYRPTQDVHDLTAVIWLTYDTDYTVSGIAAGGNDSQEAFTEGVVTLTTVGSAQLQNGYPIVVDRSTPIEQQYTYAELDNFPAKSHENALGRLAVIAQEMNKKWEQTLATPPGSSTDFHEFVNFVNVSKSEITENTQQVAVNAQQVAEDRRQLDQYLQEVEGGSSPTRVTAQGSTASRSLVERFADFVNVKDFGAIGNGVHDDTENILSAITVAKEKRTKAYMPAGEYVYSIDTEPQDLGFLTGPGIIQYTSGKRQSATCFAEYADHDCYFWSEIGSAPVDPTDPTVLIEFTEVCQGLSECNNILYIQSQNALGPNGSAYHPDASIDVQEYELPSAPAPMSFDVSTAAGINWTAHYTLTGKLGHGEGNAVIKRGDSVYLYSQASDAMIEGTIVNYGSTAYTKTLLKGNQTTWADVETPYGLFKNRPYESSNDAPPFGMITVTPDGRYLIKVAKTEEVVTERDTLYNTNNARGSFGVTIYDLSEVENAAGDTARENIKPFRRFYAPYYGMEMERSGVCSDGKYIYILVTSPLVGPCSCLCYTFSGEFVKEVKFNPANMEIGGKNLVELGGQAGYQLCSIETKGLCCYKEGLFTVATVKYIKPTSYCQHFSRTFMALENNRGQDPRYPSLWARCWYPVDTTDTTITVDPWNPTTAYTAPSETVVHHFLLFLAPCGTVTKNNRIERKLFSYFGKNAITSWSPQDFLGISLGEKCVLGTYAANYDSVFPYLTIQNDGTLELYDQDNLQKKGELASASAKIQHSETTPDHTLSITGTNLAAAAGHAAGKAKITLCFSNNNDNTKIDFSTYNKTDKSTDVRLRVQKNIECRGSVYPGGTTYDLGMSSNKWRTAYANTVQATNIQQTSDEKFKQNVEVINEDLYSAWEQIPFKQFYLDVFVSSYGNKAKKFTGCVAQDIVKAFASKGLNAYQYNFVTKTYEDNEDSEDESSFLSVSYVDILCMEAAYNRYRIAKLEERIQALENHNK